MPAATPAPAAAAPPPAPGSETIELRFVSVAFADLVGFTTLAEGRDPEEVRELLTRYFEVARELVSRYGGTVEKFIGDAVMAVWGTPTAQEDDAERAVRASLDLVEAVGQLGLQMGLPGLSARAGVLSGTAAVTVGARGQGMVAGDLVNTASRIQGQGAPGQVLVGETTKRATEAAIAYQELGTKSLKGKGEPTALFQALRVVAGLGGMLKSQRLEAPFVGRERELRLVKEVFHTSTEERRAHLVQVTGVAGIGKSRLGWEFFKYIDGLQSGYLWHRGRCLAYGQGITYFALAEMVRGRLGIVEQDPPEVEQAKLTATLEQYLHDADDRAFVAPRLAHLIGLAERTAPDQQDLFAAWRLFFERMAEDSPVVLVFEDMQWADSALLEFITYLMEWSRNFPLFVMSLVRPETAQAGLGASTRNATLIHLEPLSPGAMEQLLTGLVPGIPRLLAERIQQRAQGVPLYAVETVRMLLDRGLLVEDGAAYRPTAEIETLEVPDTLQALILARLDGMEPAERQLVQEASVLGKTFTLETLARLSGDTHQVVGAVLHALVAKEVLAIQSDPRSPERGRYGFLQDLVRTVAYETLSKRDRRSKHLAVATVLEAAAGDSEDLVEELASHYLQAWRLDPDSDDGGEIRRKARRLLVRTAERAAQRAAVDEAHAAFQRASELSESPLERGALTERAGQMAEQSGQLDEADQLYEEATRLLKEGGDHRGAARAQARLAGSEYQRLQVEQATKRMQHAYAEMATDDPDPDVAVVTAQLGRFLALQGDAEKAAPLLERALHLAELLELPDVYSQALSSKAVVLMGQDRMDEAVVLLRRALEVALEHSLTLAANRAYNNLGTVLEAQERYSELVTMLTQQLEFARRVGDRPWELSTLLAHVTPLMGLGQWDEAVAMVAEARATELPLVAFAWSQLVSLVSLHCHRGELDEAERVLEATRSAAEADEWQSRLAYSAERGVALRAHGRIEEALMAAEGVLASKSKVGMGITNPILKRALVLAGDCAIDLADPDRASRILATARDALPGQVTPWLRGHLARLSARECALHGDTQQVEPLFTAAEAGFGAIDDPFDLAATRVEHAEWLVEQARSDEALQLLAEARTTLERLGAQPWLERVRQIRIEERLPA